MNKQYPKWLYHAHLPAAVVQNPVEHEALGSGWYESPGEAEAAAAAEPETEQQPRKRGKK